MCINCCTRVKNISFGIFCGFCESFCYRDIIFWFNLNMQNMAYDQPLNRWAWVLLWDEPSATTISSDLKHSISPLNSIKVLPIFLLFLLYTLWNVKHTLLNNQCREYSNYERVNLQTSTKTKIVLNVCRPTLQHASQYSSHTSIYFSM